MFYGRTYAPVFKGSGHQRTENFLDLKHMPLPTWYDTVQPNSKGDHAGEG